MAKTGARRKTEPTCARDATPTSGSLSSTTNSFSFYRLMYLSRRTDDREIVLKRQQKIYFQISCAGHEALLVAAGLAMRPGYDWFFPLLSRPCHLPRPRQYRRRPAPPGRRRRGRLPPPAAVRCPPTGPRTRLHIVSPSSSTATQCLHAVGCAEAGRFFTNHPDAAEKPPPSDTSDYRQFKDVTFHADEVVYVSIGEGATSQGEFWEALNTASNGKLAHRLRRRGQPVRHLHPGRSQYPRRQYLPPRS